MSPATTATKLAPAATAASAAASTSAVASASSEAAPAKTAESLGPRIANTAIVHIIENLQDGGFQAQGKARVLHLNNGVDDNQLSFTCDKAAKLTCALSWQTAKALSIREYGSWLMRHAYDSFTFEQFVEGSDDIDRWDLPKNVRVAILALGSHVQKMTLGSNCLIQRIRDYGMPRGVELEILIADELDETAYARVKMQFNW